MPGGLVNLLWRSSLIITLVLVFVKRSNEKNVVLNSE